MFCPRSGSLILCTRTDGLCWIVLGSWGVMRMYCLPSEEFAVSIIIFILTRRFTASMNTSNSSFFPRERTVVRQPFMSIRSKRHSPRHRIGDPIASHNASNKHIVENDFSPPLKESVFFSRLPCVPACANGSIYMWKTIFLFSEHKKERKGRS